jgi:hypothetical protein
MATLQAALVAVVEYNLSVIHDGRLDHPVRLNACQSLTSACVAYKQISEFDELRQDLAQELAGKVQEMSPPEIAPDPMLLKRGSRRHHVVPTIMAQVR